MRRNRLAPSDPLPPSGWVVRVVQGTPAAVLVAVIATGAWSAVTHGYATFDPTQWNPGRLKEHAGRQALSARLTATPVVDEAARLGREADWLLMRDTGPQVRQGCPGWLFLAEELQVHPEGARHAAERSRTLIAVAAALRQQGIHLLVAVVPDKSRIEQARLCGVRRSGELDHRLADFVRSLNLAGVDALDLNESLQSSITATFLRTDTHWNENGAHLAAQAIAVDLRRTGVSLAPMPVASAVGHQASVKPGDLVKLAGLDRLPLPLQPRSEVIQQTTWEVVQRTASSLASAETDLFGDTGLPPVALIGTSFSRNSHFVQYLAAALGTQVASFARDGGGFSGSAMAYFNGATLSETPPKLLIWELPERVIQTPPDAAEATWRPAEIIGLKPGGS